MTSNGFPPRAPSLLAQLVASGLDAPILEPNDQRWTRLRVVPGPGMDLRDRFRGALIGGAIGDDMGRPNEGVRASEASTRKVRAYQPWHGWTGGPKGRITDDHRAVCGGAMTLEETRCKIATDWYKAYQEMKGITP